ncbi:hypothetical protein B0T21DRAFT_287415 [Apiosordaria backusii]|uniref:Uncharacterized protein n=1 Tax=Apiosordaria backusii TaxID=314023 RepID=A0AA40BNI5_9PEZI|nr:hypothetical protein B0T21DRAFT_287415 [Apiosordaria backusii]
MTFAEKGEQADSPAAPDGAPLSSYPTRLDLEDEDDSEYGLSTGQSLLGSYTAASYSQVHDGVESAENRANQYYLSHVGASFMSTKWAGTDAAANQAVREMMKKAVDVCSTQGQRRGEGSRDLICRHGESAFWCDRCAIRVASIPRVLPDADSRKSSQRRNSHSENTRRPRQGGSDPYPSVANKRCEAQMDSKTVVNSRNAEEDQV